MNTQMRNNLAVFAGGALGSVLRFAIGLFLPSIWLLWVVNLLGAAALGVVQGRAGHKGSVFANPTQQVFWGAGFCGGFTTMSGLAVAGVLLLRDLGTWPAIGYIFSQVIVGLLVHRIAIGVAAKGGDLE